MTPKKGLFALAGPLVVSFWLRAAFALVDQVYAAQLEDGEAAIAAIGLTLPFEFMMIACWVGTSNGLTARLAAAMGERSGRRIEQLKSATKRIIHVLVGAFLLIAAGIWFAAEHAGLEPDVAESFRLYATVLLAGSAFTSFWSILPDSLVKAHHDTKSTMWAGIISGLVNVALNTVFVFVFHWGIVGIALSTVLGRIAALAYASGRARMHERRRRDAGTDVAPGEYAHPVRTILAISVPAAIGFLLMSVESFAVNGILANLDDSKPALAAWAVFDSVSRFLAMPAIAASVAMLPLTARFFGARDMRSIRTELAKAGVAGVLYVGCFVTPLAIFCGPWIADFFSDSSDMRAYATSGMRWVPMAVLAMSPIFLLRSTFEGMQRPRPGLVISLLRSVILVVPLTWAGARLAPELEWPAIQGAYLGFVTGVALASLAMLLWMRAVLRTTH